MIRHEKNCEGNLSTSLLEGSEGSEAALSDCENRANLKRKTNCLETAWWFLGQPRPIAETGYELEAGTSMSVLIDITGN